MATFTFTLRGSEKLQATLTQMRGAAPAAVGAALFLEGEQIMAASKPLVPVDMGPLRASGHVQLPKVTPDHVSVTMGYGGTASGYAVYLHEGTGPAVGRPAFFPPLAVIEAWVRRNLHPAENEVRGLTFIVARAIGQRGQKPLKYLERPFNAAKPGMEGRLARSLRAWLDRQQVHDVA